MVAADPRLAETSFRALKGTSSEALRTELDARPSLQHLQLKGAPVDALVLAHVARLVALRSLDLSGSEIDDGGVGRLCADLPGLRKVQLAGCAGVGDAACRHLVQLAELEELSLNGCAGVGDAGAAVLSRANELRALDLGGTQVTDNLQHTWLQLLVQLLSALLIHALVQWRELSAWLVVDSYFTVWAARRSRTRDCSTCCAPRRCRS